MEAPDGLAERGPTSGVCEWQGWLPGLEGATPPAGPSLEVSLHEDPSLSPRNPANGTSSTEVVASVGGSEEAMRALLDPNSAWKVEAGLAVGDMAYEACELVRQMMDESRPLDSNVEVLVESRILVAPSFEEVAEYLRLQHGIEDFEQ